MVSLLVLILMRSMLGCCLVGSGNSGCIKSSGIRGILFWLVLVRGIGLLFWFRWWRCLLFCWIMVKYRICICFIWWSRVIMWNVISSWWICCRWVIWNCCIGVLCVMVCMGWWISLMVLVISCFILCCIRLWWSLGFCRFLVWSKIRFIMLKWFWCVCVIIFFIFCLFFISIWRWWWCWFWRMVVGMGWWLDWWCVLFWIIFLFCSRYFWW